MRHLGYDVWRHKFVVFMISGAFSGLAGVLWAYYSGYVSPADASFSVSVEALLIVILGGGTLLGPAVGTLVVVVIKNVVGAYTGRWLLVMGVAYVLCVLFTPKGIVNIFARRLKRRVGAP
jgi:branched-chain amino acid transport system permease protein